MLKKKILGLFIIGLGFLGITNGAGFSNKIGSINTNPNLQTLEIGVLNGVNFKTKFNNVNYKVFALNTNQFYFWHNGKIYAYFGDNYTSNGRYREGELGAFYLCNNFTGTINAKPGSCGNRYNIYDNNNNNAYNTGNDELLYNYLSNVDENNYFRAFNSEYQMVLCLSTNLDKSVCLGDEQMSFWYNHLVNPLDLGNTTFTGISTSLFQDSPFSSTGATLYCPPIKYEIDMYGRNYNTGLCYSNTEEITGGEIISTTPITIFEAFPTYEAYRQAYNLVTQNCHTDTVNTVEECRTALQTIGKKPAQILLKLINSNIPEGTSIAKVYQYCHLQLDYTEEEKRNTSTCELKEEETFYATGVTQTNNSNPNVLEHITNVLQESQEIPIPEDGTIFDQILPDGVITWKSVVFNMDFMTHFTKLFSKITTMFLTRQEKPGILPGAITSLLLLIVLFKIYKK